MFAKYTKLTLSNTKLTIPRRAKTWSDPCQKCKKAWTVNRKKVYGDVITVTA